MLLSERDPGRRSDPVPARARASSFSRTANIIFPAPASLRSIYNHASPRQPYEQLHFTLHSCVPNHQPCALPPHSAVHATVTVTVTLTATATAASVCFSLSFSLDDCRENASHYLSNSCKVYSCEWHVPTLQSTKYRQSSARHGYRGETSSGDAPPDEDYSR